MKNIILFIAVAFIGFAANAQDKKNKNAKYTVEVSGNCEQCKKRIEKAAYAVPGVKSAVWNSENQQLSLLLNEEKTSVSDVKKAIAKAGHDAGEIKAEDTDYKKLPGCCLYDRKKS